MEAIIAFFFCLLVIMTAYSLRRLDSVWINIIWVMPVLINPNLVVGEQNGESIYTNILIMYIFAWGIFSVFTHMGNNKIEFNKNKELFTIKFLLLFQISILVIQLISIEIRSYNIWFNDLMFVTSIILIIQTLKSLNLDVNKKYFSDILNGFLIISLFNSTLGIAQYVFKKTFLFFNDEATIYYSEGAKDAIRVIGLVGANNGAGNLGALLFSITLFSLYKKRNVLTVSAFAFNIIFTILTFTRIAILSIIIQMLIFLIYVTIRSIKKNAIKVVSIINFSFVLFSSLIIISYISDDLYRIFITDRGNTTDSRFLQFYYISNYILDTNNIRFIGVGTGNYISYIYENYGIYDIVIHSFLLNTLVEKGVFSFLAFTLIYILILKKMYIRLPDNYKWISFSTVLGYLIVSNGNPGQYYLLPNIIFFLFCFSIIFRYKKVESLGEWKNEQN